MTVHVNSQFARTFGVFHPSDFSPASDIAFAHALKIALLAEADLDLMHVEPDASEVDADWSEFPGVRATLARWGVLPEGVGQEAVGHLLGLNVRKLIKTGATPVESILAHLSTFAPDLIVLSTHQRGGIERWLHPSVAEPVARRSGAMTLFVPSHGGGFVSREDGRVSLRRVLVPVDHIPSSDRAIARAWALVRGLGCTTGLIRLIHVGDAEQAPTPAALADEGWPQEMVIRHGDVVGRILEEQAEWRADLLVLATQGHQGFLDAIRGSTTERVVRGARCPVLAVPEPAEPES